jgi:hypothetical protein
VEGLCPMARTSARSGTGPGTAGRRPPRPVGRTAIVSGVAALGLLATACGSSGSKTAVTTTETTVASATSSAPSPPRTTTSRTTSTTSTTTSTSTSTTSTTTTTTTLPPAPHAPPAPLTGLPEANPAIRNRPALVVKIDNVTGAFPQAGLSAADVVIEEEVEGGLTRLAAIFQSQDAKVVGPVRSTRTSDVDVVDELNDPLYAYSGGQGAFVDAIDSARIVDVGFNDEPSAYYRSDSDGHYAPHDLFTSTFALYQFVRAGQGPPPSLFQFRPVGQAVNQAGAQSISTAKVVFPSTQAQWTWNPALSVWQRWQNGSPVVDQNTGKQVGVKNVIIQRIPYGVAGYTTGEGVPSVPEPIAEQVGSGEAWILTAGEVITGSWDRTSRTTPATYTDADSKPIELTPGNTWIELIPDGSVPSFS